MCCERGCRWSWRCAAALPRRRRRPASWSSKTTPKCPRPSRRSWPPTSKWKLKRSNFVITFTCRFSSPKHYLLLRAEDNMWLPAHMPLSSFNFKVKDQGIFVFFGEKFLWTYYFTKFFYCDAASCLESLWSTEPVKKMYVFLVKVFSSSLSFFFIVHNQGILRYHRLLHSSTR